MDSLILLATNILLSLTLSTLSLWVLSKPLINILSDLCPTQKQAEFWQAYTRLMLSIAPLLLVLLVDSLVITNDPIEQIKIALMAALAGLLIGMIIVGKRIFAPVAQHCDIQSS